MATPRRSPGIAAGCASAFQRHGGVEVDTQGDAFFVAFAKASDALAAAAEGRAALEPGAIRVRMGLHTGEPLLTDEGYVGIDVHRAARIASVGHGGQILVSRSTRDLVGADSLRDLGEHRLKDLTAPERIYQLGDDDFPPLKSLNTTNLPVASNPLVGRETELAELTAMLTDSERLVTLTGAGGSGKTRLALQVGAELLDGFSGGVFFVPLASLTEPELVRSTVARIAGVRELEELADRSALRCSTTSSISSAPHPRSRHSWRRESRPRSSQQAGRRFAFRASANTRSTLCLRATRSSSSSSAPGPCDATLFPTNPRPRSVAAWTACRSRSSLPRLGSAHWTPLHCWSGSIAGFRC